nr:unnamed protein product [Callosobruchus chinensis]
MDKRKAWEKVHLMREPVTKFMKVCSKHFKTTAYLAKENVQSGDLDLNNPSKSFGVRLRCRRPLRVPLLSARHRTAQLQWARADQDWLLPQWRNVLFSDESRFGLVSDDYRERVWREKEGQNRLATAIVGDHRSRNNELLNVAGQQLWLTSVWNSKFKIRISPPGQGFERRETVLTRHIQSLAPGHAVGDSSFSGVPLKSQTSALLHKDKPMHGIFYKHLEEHGLSQQLTFSFLRSSGLKSETEGFIMACQDGVFNTLVYRSRVMGVNVPDARCRACRQAPETLMRLLSACKTYADTAYVVETERCPIYWNYSFPTLELVQANKPDIVLLDHQQKTMFIIEFSAPAEVNIVSKEEEKRTKYQELLGQLRRLWPDYTVSLLVMAIGSLGGMRNTLLSALRAIPVCRAAAHILAARMQKAVILGSLRLLRAHDTRTQ